MPEAGFELETIQKVPFLAVAWIAQLKILCAILQKRRVREILTRHDADIVVGVDGYVAAPAYSAAWLPKVLLHHP